MLLPLLTGLVAAQAQPMTVRLINPSFERGLAGWRIEGHRGLGAGIDTNRLYIRPQAAHGEAWLVAGWRARNAAPPGAELQITTTIDARAFRGRTVRLSAMTKVPPFASGAARLVIRGGAAPEGSAAIRASEGWRRHSIEFAVPRAAQAIEFGFVIGGTSGELSADDVRLEVLR